MYCMSVCVCVRERKKLGVYTYVHECEWAGVFVSGFFLHVRDPLVNPLELSSIFSLFFWRWERERERERERKSVCVCVCVSLCVCVRLCVLRRAKEP